MVIGRAAPADLPADAGGARRLVDPPAADLPPPDADADLEHGPARGRRHVPLRRDRRRGRVVRRADEPPVAALLGDRARPAARRARLRARLQLDLDRPLGERVLGGGARDDARQLPARLPAGRGVAAERRSGPRGRRPRARARAAADVLQRHAVPDPACAARRDAARGADPAGRVRHLRDPALPDVHDADLHRVPARLLDDRRLRALARARPARADGAPRRGGRARARRHRAAQPHRAARRPGRARAVDGARRARAGRAARGGDRAARLRARLLVRPGDVVDPAADLDPPARP